MGSGSNKEAEVSSNKKKLDADLEHIEDAQTTRLNLNGQDGKKIVTKARLSGSLKEFKEKVAPEVGVSKECAEHLEIHLSRYELKPDTKIIRDFTELCEVITCYCCNIEGLSGECLVWTQDSEIDLQGVEKAKEAIAVMMKQAAMEVTCAALTGRARNGCCGRWMCARQQCMATWQL